MRAIMENMILPDYVLCYKPFRFENFREKFIISIFFGNFDLFVGYIGKISKIMSYIFQSRRQIMSMGGVCSS